MRTQSQKSEWSALDIRVGINTGNLLAGILGKNKCSYDVFGFTSIVAADLEAASLPAKVNVSQNTAERVKRWFRLDASKKINVLGTDVQGYFADQLTNTPAPGHSANSPGIAGGNISPATSITASSMSRRSSHRQSVVPIHRPSQQLMIKARGAKLNQLTPVDSPASRWDSLRADVTKLAQYNDVNSRSTTSHDNERRSSRRGNEDALSTSSSLSDERPISHSPKAAILNTNNNNNHNNDIVATSPLAVIIAERDSDDDGDEDAAGGDTQKKKKRKAETSLLDIAVSRLHFKRCCFGKCTRHVFAYTETENEVRKWMSPQLCQFRTAMHLLMLTCMLVYLLTILILNPDTFKSPISLAAGTLCIIWFSVGSWLTRLPRFRSEKKHLLIWIVSWFAVHVQFASVLLNNNLYQKDWVNVDKYEKERLVALQQVELMGALSPCFAAALGCCHFLGGLEWIKQGLLAVYIGVTGVMCMMVSADAVSPLRAGYMLQFFTILNNGLVTKKLRKSFVNIHVGHESLKDAQQNAAAKEGMMDSLLPKGVPQRIKAGMDILDSHESVVVMFLSIDGVISHGEDSLVLDAKKLVNQLNYIYSLWDDIANEYPTIEKIKNNGNTYLLCAGMTQLDQQQQQPSSSSAKRPTSSLVGAGPPSLRSKRTLSSFSIGMGSEDGLLSNASSATTTPRSSLSSSIKSAPTTTRQRPASNYNQISLQQQSSNNTNTSSSCSGGGGSNNISVSPINGPPRVLASSPSSSCSSSTLQPPLTVAENQALTESHISEQIKLMLEFAKRAISVATHIPRQHCVHKCTVRLGMHVGPVVGVVIDRSKPLYDIFGDTVNMSSRLMSNSPQPNTVHISTAVHDLLAEANKSSSGFTINGPRTLELKGKGSVKTYEVAFSGYF
eukprot:TRINITY_DN67746_c6_g5_i1.p1 TRINITY_DN67746_c6_g5~~TRINITY_DN67746_c6_g5_i1.p1  ORF type:complete len:1048 (-),score=69.31 TRINITY_DN67746_c6_g5_i1:127-2814(-)